MTVSFADTFHLYGTEIFCVTGKVRAYLRHKTMATVGAVAIERQVLAVMAASTTALPALAARDRAFGQTQRGEAVDHQLKLPANPPPFTRSLANCRLRCKRWSRRSTARWRADPSTCRPPTF